MLNVLFLSLLVCGEIVVDGGLIVSDDDGQTNYEAQPIPTTEFPSIHVRAQIDGVSDLVIKGSSLHWHHIEWAAPGGGEGAEANPTYVNGIPWKPKWPEEGENRSCNCDSSEFANLSPALPREGVEPIVIPYQGRNSVRLKEPPTPENDYTMVVTFDDGPQGGANWYDATIGWMPAGESPAQSFAEKSIYVRAFVDGLSQLVMNGSRVSWNHIEGNPPGRGEDGKNLPTYINGKAWHPEWQDTGENSGRGIVSTEFSGVSPYLPESPVQVGVIRQQGRGPVRVQQQPSEANEFTLIVDFDDRKESGANWYNIAISWSGIGSPSGEDLVGEAFQLEAGEFEKVTVILASPEKIEDSELDLRRILHGEAGEKKIPGSEIFLFQDSHTLVVRDTEENLDKVQSWLERLRSSDEAGSQLEEQGLPTAE